MLSIKSALAKYYINLRGWKTNRKLIVIESDDWGSIRMPSKHVVDILKSKEYPLENNKFTLLDGLEREIDLIELFKLLRSHKDKNGNSPVITACALVANPDFEKIKDSNYMDYFYETIEQTYENYGENSLLKIWLEQGIKENLLYPQFHGREHLNPQKWLKVLLQDNPMEKEAFVNRTLLGLAGGDTSNQELYMSSFNGISQKEKYDIAQIVKDGLKLFEQIFGFKSVSFAPPQSIQFEELNKILISCGVKFSQAGMFLVPQHNGKFKKINKFWGDIDEYGMQYWRRNCRFEPFQKDARVVENCLREMDIAFRCGKPAVISSHRINYTSRICVENRNYSLEKLNMLLKMILLRWPDVEFINSSQLGTLISSEASF